MIMTGTLVIWSLSRSDNDTRMPCLSCSDECCWRTAPVWTVNGIRHWNKLIKITAILTVIIV